MKKLLKNKKRTILLTILFLILLVLAIAYIAHYFFLVNKVSIMGARNNLVDKQSACDLSEKNQITHNYIFKFVKDEQKLNIAIAYTSYPEFVPHAIEIVKTIAKTKNNQLTICNIYSYNYDNLEEAKICYSKLIRENPANADYYLARAKVQSNSENAIEDNEKGLKLLIADKTYPNKDEKLESVYCDLFNNKLICPDPV